LAVKLVGLNNAEMFVVTRELLALAGSSLCN